MFIRRALLGVLSAALLPFATVPANAATSTTTSQINYEFVKYHMVGDCEVRTAMTVNATKGATTGVTVLVSQSAVGDAADPDGYLCELDASMNWEGRGADETPAILNFGATSGRIATTIDNVVMSNGPGESISLDFSYSTTGKSKKTTTVTRGSTWTKTVARTSPINFTGRVWGFDQVSVPENYSTSSAVYEVITVTTK